MSAPAVERLLRAGREPLVLASRSARRRDLLRMLGVDFRVVEPPEDPPAREPVEDPAAYAEAHALAKARAVARSLEASEAVVLGADTVVLLEGRLLEKPRDAEEAKAHLRRLAGREHTVVTGLALVRVPDGREVTGHETSRVRMGSMDEATLGLYVSTGEPLDKAGAYGIQGVGALLVQEIHGCYFNVVGLPLFRLRHLFRILEER
jgi:septum formation protein